MRESTTYRDMLRAIVAQPGTDTKTLARVCRTSVQNIQRTRYVLEAMPVIKVVPGRVNRYYPLEHPNLWRFFCESLWWLRRRHHLSKLIATQGNWDKVLPNLPRFMLVEKLPIDSRPEMTIMNFRN